jgi:hypothetical protein
MKRSLGSKDVKDAVLSTKCPPREAFDVAVETRAFLTQRGVDVTGEQETKTKKALEFFAERLQAESA